MREMYRTKMEEALRKKPVNIWKVTPKDEEELDWYIAAVTGVGA